MKNWWGGDFREFCWYPTIDSTDWANCCTECTCTIDPQGIWWLDAERFKRHESELSRVYGGLAQGLITSQDIRAYGLNGDLNRRLSGYKPLMSWHSLKRQHKNRIAGLTGVLR